jgi:hypothetical protein
MPKLPLTQDPAHWLQRAKEARRIAEQLDDPIAKQTMQEIARSYEHLATLAEGRIASKASND